MKKVDFFIMYAVIWIVLIAIAYFTSEFIAAEFNIPFIIVFLTAVFFPPIWFFLACLAIFLYLMRGGHKRPYQPPAYSR